MDAEETEYIVMDFIREAKDKDQWRARANEYSGSVKDGEFLYKMTNY
jgi:hypothetical protein